MLSIDISHDYFCLLDVVPKPNGFITNDYAYYPRDIDLYDSEGLLIPEVLQQALEPILAGRKPKNVAITYSNLPVVANEYTFPFVKNPKQRLEMVKSKVFQSLSPDLYFMDYRITGLFSENNQTFCNLITYVVPKDLVEGTYKALKNLKKNPAVFASTQNSVFNFANKFCPEKTLIIANITETQVNLHLINQPGSIITRSKMFNTPNGLDVLSSLGLGSSQPEDNLSQATDQLSKLVQYQAIKYAGLPIEKIYLVWNDATPENLAVLQENINLPIKLLSELPLNLNRQEPLQNLYFYAYSAVL